MFFCGHMLAYKNKPAARAVLHNFRKYYPYCPVDIVVDGGGDDMRELAWTYDCSYFQESFHAGVGNSEIKNLSNEYMLRIMRTAGRYKTSHLMLIHDDNLFRGKVEHEPKYDMIGTEKSHYFFDGPLKFILEKHPHLENRGVGGCGGCLIRRDALLDAMHRYFRGDCDRFVASLHVDQLLTGIMMNAGYQFGYDDYFTEAWIPYWKTNGKPVVHAVKQLEDLQID